LSGPCSAPLVGDDGDERGASSVSFVAEVDQISSGPPARPGDLEPVDLEPGDATTDPPDATIDAPARRVSRWDRPPPPKDWRWWVGRVGYTMIASGLLLLGFVAYQLWGTGIETARAQRALTNDFEELLAEAPPIVIDEPTVIEPTVIDEPAPDDPTVDSPTGSLTSDDQPRGDAVVAIPVARQNIPTVDNGDALAQLEIPSIGVDDIVVAGVQTADLKKGPGHFPETPLPGQLGNSAIAGHRTTYGQPFHNIDKLVPGDEIIVTTLSGRYVYVVTGQQIVSPSDYQVVTTVDPTVATLTLTSCHPKWTARERIVISSRLDRDRSSLVGESVVNYGRAATAGELPAEAGPDEPDSSATIADASTSDPAAAGDDAPSGDVSSGEPADPATIDDQLVGAGALSAGVTDAGIADAFADGWFSDSGALLQVALWATVLVAIWLAGYLISRRFRRYSIGIAVAIVPFALALFFFYQNVNRLLPPNL
jgi:sortase A